MSTRILDSFAVRPSTFVPRRFPWTTQHDSKGTNLRRRLVASLLLTVPILLLSEPFRGLVAATVPGAPWLLLLLSTLVCWYGGQPFLSGCRDEIKRLQPGRMTLIAVAISVAWLASAALAPSPAGVGLARELAALIDILLLAHWFEARSGSAASATLEALQGLLPATAHRLKPDGSIENIPIPALQLHDRVRVLPHERIPLDGVVLDGVSPVDESMLTSAGLPVAKQPGASVFGGAINGGGTLTIAIGKTGTDTGLAQRLNLMRQAQSSRSPLEDRVNRFAAVLTGLALGASAVTFALWLLCGHSFRFALTRALAVMVAACPHALALALPLVLAAGTALSARSGLLIRDRAAFERARNLRHVVFAKTGTLTDGRFSVTDLLPLSDLDQAAVLRIAAAIEAPSCHPIADAILQSAHERGLELPRTSDFRGLPGCGAEARIAGRLLQLVNPGVLRQNGIAVCHPTLERFALEGKTVVYLMDDRQPLGAIALTDRIRPESAQAVRELQQMGIRCVMLTGDARSVAASVARQLRLNDFYAEVLPEDKAATIRAIQERGGAVGMVGNSVHDALAMAQADLGIAIGADSALASAAVLLLRNDPRDVATLLRMAQATWRKMLQNLWMTTGYNLVAIPLAAGLAWRFGVRMSPVAGAALMSLGTILLLIHARRLQLPQLPRENNG